MKFFDITSVLSIVLLAILLYYEFRRDLMMFQQNSYRPERYRKWLRASADSTSYTRLCGMFLFLLCLAGFGLAYFALICVSLFAIWASVKMARKRYKKPLVMTQRATRLFSVCALISAIAAAAVAFASTYGIFGKSNALYAATTVLLLAYCVSHLVLLAAAWILKPVEAHINRGFYNDAVKRLQGMPDLKIIGITGSYGKTSTKHYLHRILSEQYETLMTPGSFNTTLGVIRTIREHLKPFHQVFIVEMGAKQNGDIKEICDLVHPHMGIITAVGPQHLETFKSIENVRDTKFELVDALPANGIAVLNNDYPIIAQREVSNCHCIRYSCEPDNPQAQYVAKDIEYGPYGSSFTLYCPDGDSYRFETALVGTYNIANLTGAIAIALQLGMSIEKIRYGVSRIQAVEHRLSMRRHTNGLTILDDAFNSNPAGAAMAVSVLAGMNTGRRIIITPGMIELGAKQAELNREFGKQIAEARIDYAAVVGHYNRDAIIEGLQQGGMPQERILTFDTFLDANAWMVAFAAPGDVALIENDLPDTFK